MSRTQDPTPAPEPTPEVVDRRHVRSPRAGLTQGITAYALWGVLPLYFVALAPAGPWEIVSMRIGFALVLCLIMLGVFGQFGRFLAALTRPRVLGILAVAALLIGINWTLYTVAATSGRTLEASLGYFINPLVSILLGVLVLRERLRALQWGALILGAAAVLVMSVFYGQVPWLSLGLAFTFGFYGLVKSLVGSSWPALVTLSVETLVLLIPSAIIVGLLLSRDALVFGTAGPVNTALMVGTGVITVGPLLLFGLAASNLPLSTVGMLQYIAPILQFIVAVVVLHEAMPPERWAGFFVVWVAVVLMIADAGLAGRRRRRDRAAQLPEVPPGS
ncbi:EamA family transporter RarD [Kocuria sp. p3-SID1433]|uniref:EamA family transporter RarD n=1 Tax=unclassified Kocuria TaxID=2649579 RepID=UPI0021A7AEE7|nr:MULTISPECIES: EamA family transporter RarD [unclassified Kocuria]MCT1602329.1 EamA family transporter RarD [Kocuria sp. p3-SID1428]MCT2180966.1 EamA family transporter RarD [Kocuria sp. p3-SID1433]